MSHGFAWITGIDNAPRTELRCAIGNESHVLLMRDEQDRTAGSLQRANDIDNVTDREHIDPRRRFIEDGQLRFHREDSGELDPMPFAAAESLVDPACQISFRVQTHLPQRRFRILLPMAQTHILTNRDAFEPCRFLPSEREPQPGPFVQRERKKIGPPKEDLPGARLVAVASHEEIRQGGLPRSIGSKQGVDFARLHGEIESIENPVVSDLTGEAANV